MSRFEKKENEKADGRSSQSRVFLHATDQSALKAVDMKDLEKFAHDGEAKSGGGGTRTEVYQTPSDKPGAAIKETH